MRQYEIADIFQKRFKGEVNIMTPNIIQLGSIKGEYVYEISHGAGCFVPNVYGVTVIPVIPDESKEEYSNGGFTSIEEAKRYIQEVQMAVVKV